MRKRDLAVLSAVLCLSVLASAARAESYRFAPQGKNGVGFSAKVQPLIGPKEDVTGKFERFCGDFLYDPARPEATKVRMWVDMSSYRVRNQEMLETLNGGAFFGAEKMRFESARVAPDGRGGLSVAGRLQYAGGSTEVVLEATPAADGPRDGLPRFDGRARLRRSSLGLKFKAALEAAVDDEIVIAVRIAAPEKGARCDQ